MKIDTESRLQASLTGLSVSIFPPSELLQEIEENSPKVLQNHKSSLKYRYVTGGHGLKRFFRRLNGYTGKQSNRIGERYGIDEEAGYRHEGHSAC
ncbi:hypothetical protein [Enterocloster lavalensis]|uniref:hypothetical protein n=1 Tax=Enterocloster lavalensis TaxID=460384 RepID=UPI002A838ADF|nr:hypothetical protein [Enterocloster lavalensis]